jgi:hypothetical protein
MPLVLKIRPSLGLIIRTKVFCPQHTYAHAKATLSIIVKLIQRMHRPIG